MDIHSIESIISAYNMGSGIGNDATKISGESRFQTHYAPFDYINKNAKIAICGLTPGKSQSKIALDSLKQSLDAGIEIEVALKTAKETASFAGAMRTNLTQLLDHLRINQLLDLNTCADLFSTQRNIVHYTSALRYPVLKNEKDYSGDTAIIKNDYLFDMVKSYLLKEINELGNCIWLPLGRGAQLAFERLIDEDLVDQKHILMGLPHPSGANAERIKYFIGQKERHLLSSKVDPVKMDEVKLKLIEQVKQLTA